MLDIFNIPLQQNANYQEFFGGNTRRDWVKPRGVSMVRILLIGAGGGGQSGDTGDGGNGGGSGAVTQWIGPAMFIPDVLRVFVGAGGAGGAASSTSSQNPGSDGQDTTIVYQQKNGTGYTLLTALGGNGGDGGAQGGRGGEASGGLSFSAAGIYQSIAGQDGTRVTDSPNSVTASSTTFLTGGAAGADQKTDPNTSGGGVTPNYNYPAIPSTGTGSSGISGRNGYFIFSPVMVGTGGGGGQYGNPTGGNGGAGGIGCGGGGGGIGANPGTGGAGGRGGDGAVFIWSW